MKQSKNSPLISRPIQKTLLAFGLFAFLSQIALSIHFISIAYPGGSGIRLSEWSIYSVGLSLVPLLTFLIAYFLVPTTKSRLHRAFVAFLIAVLLTQLTDLSYMILSQLFQPSLSGSIGLFSPWIQIAAKGIVVLLLAAVLVVWKIKAPKLTETSHWPILYILGITYVVAIIQQANVIAQVVHYGNANFIALSMTILTLVVLAGLVMGTYTAMPSDHDRTRRITKALVYPLLPILLFVAFSNLFSIVAHRAGGTFSEIIEVALSTMLGGILVVYAITLVALRRKKML